MTTDVMLLHLQVSYPVAIFTTVFMVALVGLSFYQSPVTSAIGLGVFALGIPLYGIIVLVRDRPGPQKMMGKILFSVLKETYIV